MNTEELDLSDEEEEITAETVLKTLESAWQNERLAPEILPHRNDMVECMLGQIQHMERNINKLPKTDLRACIHKMELNRIKYIICNYLKTRLNKIENFCISIVSDEKQRIESGTNYLTPSEFRYAQEYLVNMENHMKNTVLNHVPGRMQTFELNKLAIYPNMQSHIFLKANDTINGIVLEDLIGDQDEEIDLEEGSQHILQYKPIADLVKNDSPDQVSSLLSNSPMTWLYSINVFSGFHTLNYVKWRSLSKEVDLGVSWDQCQDEDM